MDEVIARRCSWQVWSDIAGTPSAENICASFASAPETKCLAKDFCIIRLGSCKTMCLAKKTCVSFASAPEKRCA